jgi:hypothetical protein
MFYVVRGPSVLEPAYKQVCWHARLLGRDRVPAGAYTALVRRDGKRHGRAVVLAHAQRAHG